jgi:hypothetical protein
MEDLMANFVTVGKRLIPREHIAFVEPFDPAAKPEFKTTREFHGRVVMVNRDDSLLIEETPQAFADANGFRMLAADKIATNPAIHFRVETFLPQEGFVPSKPFATRLLWRDLDGNDQSKLLLSEPETVLSVVVQGTPDTSLAHLQFSQRGKGRRPRSAARLATSQP